MTTYRKFKPFILNAEGLRRWSECKTQLHWNVPAMVHLFYKMLNPDNHDQVAYFTREIPTLATDGRRLLANPAYFFRLTGPQQVFAVCHEICHAMYMHPMQHQTYISQELPVLWQGKALPFHPKIANYAEDFCINAMLVESKIGEIHPSWLFDDKIAGPETPWQEAYHRIFEECEKAGGAKGQPGPGKGGGDDGDDRDDREGEGQLPQDPADQDTTGTNPRFEAGQFDKHLLPGATDQKAPSDGTIHPNPPRWAQAIEGALAVGRSAGRFPGALEKALEHMLRPVVPWTDHIQGFLARKVHGTGYDFRRLDRRLLTRGIGAPGKSGHSCGTLIVAVDASGSIYACKSLLERFFAELAGMFEDLNPRKIVVMWWDSAVQRVDEIEDSQDLADVYYKGAKGGGGTCFSPVLDEIERQAAEGSLDDVDAMVVLTDGDIFDLPDVAKREPDFPVIWGVIADGKSFPFGDVVRIPDDGTA